MKHGAPGVGDGGDGGLTSGVLVANFAFGSFFIEKFDLHSYQIFEWKKRSFWEGS